MVWIRKGTVSSKMLKFLNLKYSKIKSISEYLKKAIAEYKTYLERKRIQTVVTIYKIDKNQSEVTTFSHSYYITALKHLMKFYEDFYFDREEWD